MPVIKFIPSEKSLEVKENSNLLEVARIMSIEIPANCGGKGLCGKCRVRIVEGEADPERGHENALSPAELKAGWRLACLVNIKSDLTVQVPEVASKTVTLVDFGATDVEVDRKIESIPAKMEEPSLEDQSSDMERLSKAVGREISSYTSLDIIRELPQKLRDSFFRVSAVMLEDELMAVEPYAEDTPLLGLAVDVGTTTIAGVLCDLRDGRNLATASCTNPQAIHGDDVISRIEYSSKSKYKLVELQNLVATALNGIAEQASEAAGFAVKDIYKIVAAGNTTMYHLLLGISPQHIGVSPFVAVRREGLSVRAHNLGINISRGGRLYAMPNISGYVGGDILAGISAYRLDKRDENILYIDVGTNGEMALRSGGRLYVCSTAAGPAFEGARISCGMRASTGAISKVNFTGENIEIETIENAPPRGICGTGLLDAVAAFLDAGVLDETGRFAEGDELAKLSPEISSSLEDTEEGKAYVLSQPECDTCPKVSLTEKDIREVQLAKGAVAAGFKSMLALAGIDENKLDKVILAGAFGSFLRPESAKRVGLLPVEIPIDKIEFVGNAALAGARVSLLNINERKHAEEIARETEYIELSGRADFQMFFMETMMFPTPS